MTLELTCKEGADSTKIISIGSLCSSQSPQPCRCVPASRQNKSSNKKVKGKQQTFSAYQGFCSRVCPTSHKLQVEGCRSPETPGRSPAFAFRLQRGCVTQCRQKLESLKNKKLAIRNLVLKKNSRNSPGVPVSETPCSQCRGSGSICSQGTRSHMPQLKNTCAATATQHSQKKKNLQKPHVWGLGCLTPGQDRLYTKNKPILN